jgi:hypothetical protein
MGAQLAEGTRALVVGFELLRKDPEAAGRQSDAASDAVHHVERDYREAMAELLRPTTSGPSRRQDLYRRYLGVAEAIVAVAGERAGSEERRGRLLVVAEHEGLDGAARRVEHDVGHRPEVVAHVAECAACRSDRACRRGCAFVVVARLV